ncbi:MAG: hypothetical protein NTW86_16270 [Candidatus Sumerlaeota bacterium]|nr:hypothetical protein [Candidatus Sumerlaeota bacterium]
MKLALPAQDSLADLLALRKDIVESPISVGLERARAFTRVWQANENAPWIVLKGMALREHLQTVPLYIRRHDRIAGSISERPGAMPLIVELGVGENPIYTGEYPHRRGYLRGQVPREIDEWWEDRCMWGRHRAFLRTVLSRKAQRAEEAAFGFISNQGHLSPSYRELLSVGLGGILRRVRDRRAGEIDPQSLEFLAAAEQGLLGVMEWIERYSQFLRAEAGKADSKGRERELREMSDVAAKVAREAPATFREAMQLIWFVHQAVHVEGHGYSNTPDRVDQLLYPFYIEDKQAGRLDDEQALALCANFLLKQRDNTFWGPEHNMTQGLVVGGSTPDGEDQTNELSWLFIAAAGAMAVPEPLVWARWHPRIDRDFFDFCLQTIAGKTCFPLMMSDTAVPAMFMAMGVEREDAFNYVPCGCNELGIPGQAYYNAKAHWNALAALEAGITGGRGYDGEKQSPFKTPPPQAPKTFQDLIDAIALHVRRQVETSYADGLLVMQAEMRYGQTPFTSCFFDGCIERGRDMILGTKYNFLSCGGGAFVNLVDALGAIREVVYEKKEAALEDVAAACRDNFVGHEALRAKLLAAPKHGNDDPRLDDIIDLVERLRDEPVKSICRDPRDGTPYGISHVIRSSAVRGGLHTGATPDGRLAGTPLASSVAAAAGCERHGPTAVLNSILKLHPARSWQCGYNVNLRFQHSTLAEKENREKVHAMLASFFGRGGQEMQINCVSSETLRAAQRNPDAYRDVVVRVAGFSDFFVNLLPEIQNDIISRTEH